MTRRGREGDIEIILLYVSIIVLSYNVLLLFSHYKGSAEALKAKALTYNSLCVIDTESNL